MAGLVANSFAQQTVLTSFIRSRSEHTRSNRAGEQKITDKHRARDSATLSRFLENKKSIPRGASSALDEAIDMRTTAASCP